MFPKEVLKEQKKIITTVHFITCFLIHLIRGLHGLNHTSIKVDLNYNGIIILYIM